MTKKYQTFAEFYPFYLSQHQQQNCRLLHYIGSCCALFFIFLAIWQQNAWYILVSFISGYAFAWVGHFFIEQNKPATFTYPWWSFIADWRMFWQAITGKL